MDSGSACLTQADLASGIGIAAPNIAAYESDRRPLSDELDERIKRAARPLPSAILWANADEIKRIAYRHGASQVSVFGPAWSGSLRSDIDLLVALRSGTDLFDLFGRYEAELVGRGRAEYDRDLMLQLAAEAIVARLGEAVSRLDPAFVAARPDVPFRQARGIRTAHAPVPHR